MCPVYMYGSHHDRHAGLTTTEPQWLSAREKLIKKPWGFLMDYNTILSFVATSFPELVTLHLPLSGIR